MVPASVTWQGSRPSRAQRVTVFGDTPSSFETSDRGQELGSDGLENRPISCVSHARRISGRFGSNK